MKLVCPICDLRGKDKLYRLPQSLTLLGYDATHAHPRCVSAALRVAARDLSRKGFGTSPKGKPARHTFLPAIANLIEQGASRQGDNHGSDQAPTRSRTHHQAHSSLRSPFSSVRHLVLAKERAARAAPTVNNPDRRVARRQRYLTLEDL